MRAVIIVAAGLVVASCGGGPSPSSSSDGGGGTSPCTAKYCCTFDGPEPECVVDNADVLAFGAIGEWVVQTESVSPPSSMRLEYEGSYPNITNFGLFVSPKAAANRFQADFALRISRDNPTAATVFVMQLGIGNGFVLYANGARLQLGNDSGMSEIGALPDDTWVAVTTFVDLESRTYGAGINGGLPVTRAIEDGADWRGPPSPITFGVTRTTGTTAVHYDDVRVDW